MRYFKPKFGYTHDNKRKLEFNNYTVEEKGNNYVGIYRHGVLITSRTTFKSACKVAKLLEEAFIEGYNCCDEWHDCCDEWHDC